MAVLLIGGGGLLGKGIVKAFAERGQNIIVYSGHAPESPVKGNIYYQGDVTEYGTLQNIMRKHDVDCVIHNAAISSPLLHKDNPYKVCRTNVQGTLTALEAAKTFGVKRFIYISSAAVYGAVDDPYVYVDASRRYADSIYGATKIACEELVRNYGLEETVSLRYGYIYGPGRTVTCPIRQVVLDVLKTGVAVREQGAEQLQDYLYIDDASRAILAVYDAKTWPKHEYNIASGQLHSFSEVLDIVAEEFPEASLQIGRGTAGFTFQAAMDIEPIKEDFGWAPEMEFPIGLKLYIQWLKESTEK